MYLLDTNIISEMRKIQTRRGNAGVKRWSQAVPLHRMFLSDITILESQTGILLMQRKDPVQAQVLREWLHDQVLPSFEGRLLGINTEIAFRCAPMHVPVTAPYRDALIAATALVHGLTVVTRNVKDFAPTGVAILNPWED